MATQLAQIQTQGAAQPRAQVAAFVTAANTASASIHLDEAEPRKLIDEQLRQAGWEADSTALRYAAGARPAKSRKVAIAEWPTASGPADYVLFVGLTAVAGIEPSARTSMSQCALNAFNDALWQPAA